MRKQPESMGAGFHEDCMTCIFPYPQGEGTVGRMSVLSRGAAQDTVAVGCSTQLPWRFLHACAVKKGGEERAFEWSLAKWSAEAEGVPDATMRLA